MRIVAGATVHPADDDPVGIVRDAVERLGCRVLKLHCSVGDFPADDPRLEPVWAQVERMGMPVVVHVGHGVDGRTHAHEVGPIDVVARRHPAATIIIAHCANPAVDAALDLVERHTSVYADLTPVLTEPTRIPAGRVAAVATQAPPRLRRAEHGRHRGRVHRADPRAPAPARGHRGDLRRHRTAAARPDRRAAAVTGPDAATPSRSATAVAALFFVNGATYSNWLPRVPEIRDRLGLDNAGLGAALLGGGLGGILGSLAVGRLMDRVGSRRQLATAATGLSICLPLIALVPHAALLLLVLTALGTLDVLNDVAMNAQGVIVQNRLGRSIMHRLHAMWSLGFTAGAVVGSAAAAAHVGVRAHLVAVGAILLLAVQLVRRWLVGVDPPHPSAPAAPSRGATVGAATTPRKVGMVMAIAAVAAAALEVAPNEWGAVLMRDVFDGGRTSGFGTVAFAGAMLVGRLGGDHVLDRIGERRLLAGSIAIGALGVAITALAPVSWVAFGGLALWGLGISVMFPQLYATAARLPGMSAGAGLGSMLLGQRFGGLITAGGVGLIAGRTDLRVAFAVVGAVAVAVLALTVPIMTRAAPSHD